MGKTKKALITGVTGQDGSYLAKFLLDKGYQVVGTTRNRSESNLANLKFLSIHEQIELALVDLEDKSAVENLISTYKPHEIYNLAAQSSVGQSFKIPSETFYFNTSSVVNFLEGIRKVDASIKFYQASSSEMFGNVDSKLLPIKESLAFNPVSPYGISKASAHWLTNTYRNAYGIFAACGILFNHESCLRGENFVVKKIINTAVRISRGEDLILELGNLDIYRDWGYAPKYVEAMWAILQQQEAQDVIICSGQSYSLQQIVVQVFDHLKLDLRGNLQLNREFMRPVELHAIVGDHQKARTLLHWDYDIATLQDLIAKLVHDEFEWLKWREQNKIK
ncbi:MAG: GDP-mannose 4,6-dehydratase [Leeuwenhoekiella sp.]|nr:MAG: GDP-mannose 4,6-dehydratase [Leeuwenhoekiella sp.]